MPGLGVERLEAPIVENEQLDAAEGAEEPAIAAVAAGEREIAEELGHALVEDGAVVAAGLVTEGCGEPTFADTGRARDILRKNSPSKLSSDIRIIRAPANTSSPFDVFAIEGATTL